MTLLVWSAAIASASAPAPLATRTTTTIGSHWSTMACRVFFSVPRVPALPMAVRTSVSRTGWFSGKAATSASAAVAIRPMIAVEMVRM